MGFNPFGLLVIAIGVILIVGVLKTQSASSSPAGTVPQTGGGAGGGQPLKVGGGGKFLLGPSGPTTGTATASGADKEAVAA